MMTWLLLVALLVPARMPRQAVGGTIAGEIRQPDGAPAVGVRVGAATFPAQGITVLTRVTETDASGHYLLEDLAAGQYYVVAGPLNSPTYYPGTITLTNARSITIGSGSKFEAVNFSILRFQSPAVTRTVRPAAAVISGRVVTDNGRPLPGFFPKLFVYLGTNGKAIPGPDGVKIRGSGTFGATPVSKDGTFSLALEDGEYPISLITSLGELLTAADGYYVKAITSGGTDLMKEKLKVSRTTSQTITITIAATP